MAIIKLEALGRGTTTHNHAASSPPQCSPHPLRGHSFPFHFQDLLLKWDLCLAKSTGNNGKVFSTYFSSLDGTAVKH